MKLVADPNLYTPPQITETWGETQFTDCTWASGLGLVDIWVTGAATRDAFWRPLSQARLKAEREKLRAASGDLTGGSTLDDLARGVEAYYPDLPPLRTSTAGYGPTSLSADELIAALMDDKSALLQGNPSRIKDQTSFLRTAQNNDDYDHAVLGIRARSNGDVLVMDPLRPWSSSPRWVPKTDIIQFLSRFKTPTGLPYYALVKRGAQSEAGQTAIANKALRAQLAGKPVSCDGVEATARAQALADVRDAISKIA